MAGNYISADVKEAARGRWRQILPALGVDPRRLGGRHCPCPACGGKDRFRFDDLDGRGTFYCNQYGAGDGFALIRHCLNCGFREAAQTVAGVLGLNHSGSNTSDNTGTQTKHAPSAFNAVASVSAHDWSNGQGQDKAARLNAVWNAAKPIIGTPAAAYLAARGLDLDKLPESDALRFAYLPYWTQGAGKPLLIGTFAAMIAAIRHLDGTLAGLHLTYLQPCGGQWQKLQIVHPETGEPLPAKKMQARFSGSIKGTAVQIDPPAKGCLAVAEGIESALAARELFGLPVWACLSAGGMKRLVLPPDLKELLIAADNDMPRGTGYAAAHDLALQAMRQGVKVRISQSATENADPLDELNRLKAQSCLKNGFSGSPKSAKAAGNADSLC